MSVQTGTGLGLSISKNFAELMGGTIEVESEADKGALFRVQIPAGIVEAADVKTTRETEPGVIGLVPGQKAQRVAAEIDRRAAAGILLVVCCRVLGNEF